MRNHLHHLVMQKNHARKTQEHKRRRVEQHCAPAPLLEQVVANRIDGAEMKEQRRGDDQTGVTQKGDGQIEIAICAERRIKVIDERSEAEAREVHHERRAAALLEDYK